MHFRINSSTVAASTSQLGPPAATTQTAWPPLLDDTSTNYLTTRLEARHTSCIQVRYVRFARFKV